MGEKPGKSKWLGKLELTQQPEKLFYKDEGGQRHYYLFLFFVLRGERTEELKRALNRVADGRRKIRIGCEVVYDSTLKPVEDQRILQLFGNSKEEKTEMIEEVPEFDPITFQGSIRYRFHKVSMRKDNQGFRLRIFLPGLEDEIEEAISEPTIVLSKRKRLRKEHREPELAQRNAVETLARKRNAQAEQRLSRCAPNSTPLIHELDADRGFVFVPNYPELKVTVDEPSELTPSPAPKRPKRDGAGKRGSKEAEKLQSQDRSSSGMEAKSVDVNELNARVAKLEEGVLRLESILNRMQGASYDPGDDPDQSVPAPGLLTSSNRPGALSTISFGLGGDRLSKALNLSMSLGGAFSSGAEAFGEAPTSANAQDTMQHHG